MSRRSLLLALAAAASAGAASVAPSAPSAQNLLYIVVDDLRPEIGGVYGADWMVTPGIQALQERGTTFTRAYCNVPLCSPSRTSFLTGTRPSRNHLWTIGPYFRNQTPDAASIVTVTQALIAGGINATGAGKIWHPGTSSGSSPEVSTDVGGDDVAFGSWSYPETRDVMLGFYECDEFYNGTVQSSKSIGYPGGIGCVQSAECQACFAANNVTGSFMRSFANLPCADDCFPDGLVAQRGLEELQWKAANPGAGPWALFLGMKRPHLNFFAPSWAYDLYDESRVQISSNRFPSIGMPEVAFYENAEISGGEDVKPFLYTFRDADGSNFTLVNDTKHASLRWAYRSSVSYMDSQVLRVLNELDALGLSESTWIVFHGDHGWALGEKGEWAKTNLYESGTRVPLIIVPPKGLPGFGANATFPGIVELVDVYPTLAELLGLGAHVPPGQLTGDSLVPALKAPAGGAEAADADAAAAQRLLDDPAFSVAYSEICRGQNRGQVLPPPDGSVHGLSVRTKDWRFSAWLPFNYTAGLPLWSRFTPTDVELYDHRGDTGSGWEDLDAVENVNLALQVPYADVVQELLAMVKAQWPGM